MVPQASPALLPPKIRDLFFRPGDGGRAVYVPSRYKIAYGGRGSAKSWSFGRMSVALGASYPLRVLCVRETQVSIRESIHQLLADQIGHLGLNSRYDVQRDGIYGRDFDTQFIFAGVRTDPDKIKSLERIDVCLVEEAHKFSEASWRTLIPTVRNPQGNSELWICFNPRAASDPTSVRFIEHTPPQCRRTLINFCDNPWFPADLELERQYALRLIAEANDDDERAQLQADYDHVWLGAYQRMSNASVIRRWVEDEFEDPPADRQLTILYGVDWGYSVDPTALVRFWIDGDELWISHEAYGYRVELNDLPALFDTVPGVRRWPIKADSAAPATISHIRSKKFNIEGAKKWPGSLEDGIRFLNGFRRIHIHRRCTHLLQEARLYSYKVDRVTEEVLPIIVDANNHGWDAVRYGLDGYITQPVGGFFNTRRLVS